MKRQELEALDTPALRSLIIDATMILAARAEQKAGGGSSGAKAAAPPAQESGLFMFGVATGSGSAAAPAPAPGGGLFSSTSGSSTSSLFGGPAMAPGKLFGGTGGGLFGGAVASGGYPTSKAAAAPTDPSKEDEEKTAGGEGGDEDRFVEEEEVVAIHGWTPSITLEVKTDSVETGEEQEEQIYTQRSKLYRWRDGEWKERGLGEAKLLKDKATSRVRFLMRQEKTGKVVANHYVIAHDTYCDLRPNADSEKIWVWLAQDFSEGTPEVEQLALKFGTVELAEKFKVGFEDAKRQNKEVSDKQEDAAAKADAKKS